MGLHYRDRPRRISRAAYGDGRGDGDAKAVGDPGVRGAQWLK